MNGVVWYVARSAGIVAYLLLSGSVVLGLLMSTRADLGWPRFAVEDVHRFAARLTGVFIVIHGGALLLDDVVPFSLRQELVPFTSSYRPFGVALGVVSAELLAAIGITNLLRDRLSHTVWRRVHMLTIAVWLGTSAHLLLVGTDRADPWLLGLCAAAFTAVLLALAPRLGRAGAAPAGTA
jgi:methionine sulfoxide reductase heme-binding subunit